ncbi:unnamed protein product [Larinioides sclopetarius]|uniref:Uncharacterized protein n=1 Tax=Larinioides sclopetarius TaxID=280406 RepID=A0AAV2C0B6_9ARAC
MRSLSKNSEVSSKRRNLRDSIRNHRRFENVTQHEVEMAIKKWLYMQTIEKESESTEHNQSTTHNHFKCC